MYMKQLCLLTQPCCGFLCNVLLIEQTVAHVWPSHVDIYLIGKLVKEGVATCVCDIVIERLLTLGAHALQGNSSVCVCVCAVRFFQWRISQEDLRFASALQLLI